MNPRPNLIRILLALALASAACGARAQSCTITTGNLASGANYNPFSAAFNDTAGLFSISCTRPKGGTAKFPGTFYVGATNGANYLGGRRLAFGTNYLSYELYRNYSGCSTPWGSTAITDVYSYANSNTQGNDTTTNPNPLTSGTAYCFRITGGANTAVPGTYSDTVQIGIAESPTVIWGTAAVTLSTTIVPACTFITQPGAMTLNYTSFSSSPVSASTPFQLRCTNSTTYTLGFDTPTGTVLGLNYNLSLNTGTGTGSGVPQGYTVTATLPAGQAGTCSGASCTSTITRSVLVTY